MFFNFPKKSSSEKPSTSEMNIVDENILNIIKQQIADSDIKTIIDVGAHLGRYALAALKFWPNAQIFCFEPYPNAYKELVQNLKIYDCKIYNCAIAENSQSREFYINANIETNSLLKSISTQSNIDVETANVGSISVTVTTLDEIFKSESLNLIDLLKIDVQGSTLPVLQGASLLLKNKLIKIIQCEVEFIRIYENEKLFHSICNFLEGFGYQLYSLYNLHYDINGRLSWADALFTLEIK